ncbi:unnamed protein product [Ilex paraguariensis]|uniref:Uncharacterized protein n=1 Tax=Ilex paraguariensis TaxID=185542 RepID=A0ABC8R4S9_9AQUA
MASNNPIEYIMTSEITEDEDEEALYTIDTEAKKNKIRRIIEYQKSLYFSSSSSTSFSSAAASCSSFSSSRRSSSLLELMKEGSTSLRRLFDMEHTSLAAHLRDYSCSPVIKPILLWGSDTDDGVHDDPWRSIKQIGDTVHSKNDGQSGLASEGSFFDGGTVHQNREVRMFGKRKLIRTKSFRRLPRFRVGRCGGFTFRFRLIKRLRIMICGRKF